MSKGIFIIGTDTDVGKTFITAGINYVLKVNGYSACAFKPIQSGCDDTEFVRKVCNIEESKETMNAYSFENAVSPHLAARLENIFVEKNKILEKYKKLQEKYDYIIVEGAGGLVVPLIENNYFIYDMVKDLNLDCVIVGRAGVGTINHTVLTYEFAKRRGINIKGIIINGYTGVFYEDDNINAIKNITGLDIISKIRKVENFNLRNVQEEYKKSIGIKEILSVF